MRRDQHHDLVHHQAHFTFLVEDALIVEGEQQGQGDLLDQLAERLGAAVQLAVGHQAGEQGGQRAFQRVQPVTKIGRASCRERV